MKCRFIHVRPSLRNTTTIQLSQSAASPTVTSHRGEVLGNFSSCVFQRWINKEFPLVHQTDDRHGVQHLSALEAITSFEVICGSTQFGRKVHSACHLLNWKSLLAVRIHDNFYSIGFSIATRICYLNGLTHSFCSI